MLIDSYTFTEFEDAMHGIVDGPVLPQDFRILIDRRRGGCFSDSFVSCAVNLFRAHEAHLAGTRAAVLVSKSVSVVLPNLRIGRFHLRAFHDGPRLNSGCIRVPVVRQCTVAPLVSNHADKRSSSASRQLLDVPGVQPCTAIRYLMAHGKGS